MDCQKIMVYGLVVLISIYLLKDVCGVKMPFIEGFDNVVGENSNQPMAANSMNGDNGVISGNMDTLPIGPGSGNGNGNGNGNGRPSNMAPPSQVIASEPFGNEVNLPVQGMDSVPAPCYPQNRLSPEDLLPNVESGQIESLNQKMKESGEGYLAGINFLDAGFNMGINTVGQSLRNANLNLRAEPPNPRTMVSPWMNSTIDVDLGRKSLGDTLCGGPTGPDGLDA